VRLVLLGAKAALYTVGKEPLLDYVH